MVWHNIDQYYNRIIGLQTTFGKLWYINIIVFRLFVVLVVGEELYQDEHENFKCETTQPGCRNVCFNMFSPISHIRFWALQLMICAVPVVVFNQFAIGVIDFGVREMGDLSARVSSSSSPEPARVFGQIGHSQYMDVSRRKSSSASKKLPTGPRALAIRSRKGSTKYRRNNKTFKHGLLAGQYYYNQPTMTNIDLHGDYGGDFYTPEGTCANGSPVNRDRFNNLPDVQKLKIHLAYILMNISKISLESFFIFFGYKLQFLQSNQSQFWSCFTVPEKYICRHGQIHNNDPEMSPCAQQNLVSCWVSRPKEKEYFLRYMVFCQIWSVLLSFLDIFHVAFKIFRLVR